MNAQCKLLEGAAAVAAQALLACAAIFALVYKRHKERPQRAYRVWSMDVSKQIVSTGAAHVCGIIIAIIASAAGRNAVSQCAWYFVAFAFDTTLGVAAAISIHTLVIRFCKQRAVLLPQAQDSWWHFIAACGNYGMPPRWKIFVLQLVEWTSAVVLARIICGSVVIAAKGTLVHVAEVLDRAFRGHPMLLLFFVMIMCPLCMNLLQALVQDAVLKSRKVQSMDPGEADAANGINPEEDKEGSRPKREQEDVRLLATTMRASSYVPADWGGQPGKEEGRVHRPLRDD